MAISDSFESVATTTTATTNHAVSDLNTTSIRRRPNAATAASTATAIADVTGALSDSSSGTESPPETENSLKDLVGDSASDGSSVERVSDNDGDRNGPVDSVNAENDKKENVEKVASGDDRAVDFSPVKFAYLPHRRVKESPLSSDAIFRQVLIFNSFSKTCHLSKKVVSKLKIEYEKLMRDEFQ